MTVDYKIITLDSCFLLRAFTWQQLVVEVVGMIERQLVLSTLLYDMK